MNQPLTKQSFEAAFVHNSAGAAILNYLKRKYWSSDIYTKGDVNDTIFQLGQRDVIRFIMTQLDQIKKGDE